MSLYKWIREHLLTAGLSGAFIGYILYSLVTLFSLFSAPPCDTAKQRCLRPFLPDTATLKMQIFTSKSPTARSIDSMSEILTINEFQLDSELTRDVNVSLPMSVRNNGSLFVYVFLLPTDSSLQNAAWSISQSGPLTRYAVRQPDTFQLVADSQAQSKVSSPSAVDTDPVSHWQAQLTVNVLAGHNVLFDAQAIPGELYRYIRVTDNGRYLPVLYINELCNRIKDLVPLNKTSKMQQLRVVYQPATIGQLRLWTTMLESFKQLRAFGFQDREIDDMKGLIVDTNLYALLLTFLVAAFHLLFDFLAFKNDINYWRKRNSMVGLSSKTVIWRCVSTLIVFLYLLDEQTSLLVLVPTGISAVIEIWKVLKAFKVKISFSATRLIKFDFGILNDREKETDALDSQAMGRLSYLLYPLCIAGAVYSLLYTPHKSWYSWSVKSLVNGVYAFGFLFMLPQLYINYKLKSVAHLPWRAFMYKAFNTFIDDVFAFIITMPTAHRVACFRDDIVFLIYLYQRWLYPVDKARVNEFGQSFEEDVKKKEN